MSVTASQSSIVGSGGNVSINVDPPPVDAAALIEQATAVIVAGLQWKEIQRHNEKLEQDAIDARQFLCDKRLEYRVESMGGPGREAYVQGVYQSQYIPSLEANGSFSTILADAKSIYNVLNPAIGDGDTFVLDLFNLNLKNERLSNLASLRGDAITADTQIFDKNIEIRERRRAIGEINQAAIDLATAKESGINLAFKEEVSRIDTEDSRRGYVGGDCMRDMMLLNARLKLQDNIAVNFAQTDLENEERLEGLNEQIARELFDLSERNRGAQFDINEDDVNKRLNNLDLPAQKIDVNQRIKQDAPEDLVNRAWNRRYDRSPFQHEEGPVSSTVQASRVLGDSPFAVAASSIGGLLQQGARGGFAFNQGSRARTGATTFGN